MDVNIKPGKYILAVSGGVDSVSLMHLLSRCPGLTLIVAHFNHGIRPDSDVDEKLVRSQVKALDLPFRVGYGKLGANASEEKARIARYNFLRSIKSKHQATGIVTAHHQDDKIETALINILRGTGRRGLSAISNNPSIIRPLLDTPKTKIIRYAQQNHLKWREDPTNASADYLRNYLRLKVLPKLDLNQRQRLISNIDKVAKTNEIIDHKIATLSQQLSSNNQIRRAEFTSLPSEVSNEWLSYWLRSAGLNDFDRKTINRLSLAIKTAKSGAVQPVKRNACLKFESNMVYLEPKR
ncbi:MAG TPA: tRNA lysidine(34) synthetase TilS [Candidatus Saccharimonadales bacterium]|nr:tRNA lysidine(34) synthetase TilS [Candidatus Saccharimonadales bacterium]